MVVLDMDRQPTPSKPAQGDHVPKRSPAPSEPSHEHKAHVPSGSPKVTHQPRPEQQAHVPPEALMQTLVLLYNVAMNMLHRFRRRVHGWVVELQLKQLADEAGIFLRSHPVAAVVVTILTLACGIPVLIFVAFAIITVFLTFSGFLIIEGTVLAAGSIALIVALIAITTAFTATAVVATVIYGAFLQVSSLMGRYPVNGQTRQPFDSRVPRVLASLQQIPAANPVRHRHNRSSGHASTVAGNDSHHPQSESSC